jgi:hypothetical protein
MDPHLADLLTIIVYLIWIISGVILIDGVMKIVRRISRRRAEERGWHRYSSVPRHKPQLASPVVTVRRPARGPHR